MLPGGDPRKALEATGPCGESGGPAREAVDPALSDALRASLRAVLPEDGSLDPCAREKVGAALALIDESREGGFRLVHYRGDRPFFPGDLVSLFYLAGVCIQIQHGAIPDDAFVERDILRTIRDGNADAANLLLDRITGTLSGPELPEGNLEVFARRRGRLDELLRGIGVVGTRCIQKIWHREPYGRDEQLLGKDRSQDNQVTAIATAFLLAKMLLGQIGGPEASRNAMDLLQIDLAGRDGGSPCAFRLVRGLPPGARAWGRRAAGPRLLHEVTAVELPGGTRYVLAVLSYLGQGRESLLDEIGRGIAGSFP